ncbi:hypothetical protein BG015_009791, partial [Linnemannia schmuckeri]
MDGMKVCGFHMHALEWHHMQTVGIDQILDLAKLTGCEVFNMSIMRWLSDSVRPLSNTFVSIGISPTATSTNNNRSSSSRISSSATSKNDLASNSIAGLSLKLFRRIQCHCRREAVIAVASKPIPPIPVSFRSTITTTTTTTTTTRATTQTIAAKEKKKHYVVVCRGRAYQDPLFEICDRPLEGDAFYGYYNRSWMQPGGTVSSCSFCINLEIAIYGHAVEAVHKCIPTTPWLAQWLSPFNKVLSRPSAQPIPTSRSPRISRPVSAAPFSSFSSSRMSSGRTGASSPRLTDQMVSTIQRSLKLSETTRQLSRKTTDTKSPTAPTTTTIPVGPPPSRLLTAWDFRASGHLPRTSLSASILSNAGLMQKQQQAPQDGTRKRTTMTSTKGVSRLVELDRKLEETVAWHVAKVTSIMKDATQNYRSSSSSIQDYSYTWQQYSNYNEFDMTEYPGIAMHLCQWCKDNARDFCVVPTLKNQPDLPSRASNSRYTATMTNGDRKPGAAAASVDCTLPPSPPRSPDELMYTIESDADRDRVT